MKTCCAISVPYDWLQLYQNLQTSVVSGQYVQVTWQELYQLYEVQKFYTEVGGALRRNHLSMDLKAIQKSHGHREGLAQILNRCLFQGGS